MYQLDLQLTNMKKYIKYVSIVILFYSFYSCIVEKEIKIKNLSYTCVEDFTTSNQFKNIKNDFTKELRDTIKVDYEFVDNLVQIKLYTTIGCERKCSGNIIQKGDTIFISVNVLIPENNEYDTNCLCPYQLNYSLSGLSNKKAYSIFFLRPHKR